MTALNVVAPDLTDCPEGVECDEATACINCDHPLCPDHSDDFTTCVLGGLHCGACRDLCGSCSAAAFEEGRL